MSSFGKTDLREDVPRAILHAAYYAPPEAGGGRPMVITWFRVYAISIACLCLLGIPFFVVWQFFTPDPTGTTIFPAEFVVLLMAVAAIGALFFVAGLVPFKPWGWMMGLFAIGLGLASCLLPAAVPLLVFWLKPETKAAFRRV